ncbi:MAG: hypothetical protein AABP62_18955 [Planctomycetota bacterium]
MSQKVQQRQGRFSGLARRLVGCGLIIAVYSTAAARAHAETYTPEGFGAVGNGVANDQVAVAAAFEAVRAAGGGRIEFNAGRTYNLGPLSNTGAAGVSVLNLRNATIDGNGAELVVNTTGNFLTAVIQLTGAQNVRLNNLRFRDVGTDLTVDWRGAAGVQLIGSSVESGKVLLDRCSGDRLVYLFTCADHLTARIKGITLRDCSVSNSYYGINCQNNGDGLRATGFRAENIRRAYFVYGIEDHDVDLSIQHDGVALGHFSACIIGNQGQRDTRGIRIKARFLGNTSKYGTGVDVQHQRASTVGGLISGIDATVDVFAPSTMVPVRFRSFHTTSTGATQEEVNTANRITDVRLSGNLDTTGPESIGFGLLTKQGVTALTPDGVEGRLFFDTSILHPQIRLRAHYPSFVISTTHGRELRTIKGSLSTQFMTIPCAAFDAHPFEIVVTTWVQDELAAVAAAKRTYVKDVLFLQNAGGGNVLVKLRTPLANTNINGAATVTYTPSGEDLRINVTGYAGTNGLWRTEVEYVSRGP